jgi:hypothetical protein
VEAAEAASVWVSRTRFMALLGAALALMVFPIDADDEANDRGCAGANGAAAAAAMAAAAAIAALVLVLGRLPVVPVGPSPTNPGGGPLGGPRSADEDSVLILDASPVEADCG